jgi:hypothetical protein
MTKLQTDLETRRDEFETHFALARALEDRMMLDSSLGSVSLSARHINAIKSGLLVHLYNVEEAIMTQIMEFLGVALGESDPRRWTEQSLREWLRASIVSRTLEGNEDGRLDTVYNSSNRLLTQSILGPQELRKPSGTWDDKAIRTFALRMNVSFNLPEEMRRRIAASGEYGDKTPLQFLADRRNAIAHGRRSFEDGASDLSLNRIRELACTTLDYMEFVVDAFHVHVENNAHLVPGT